MRIRTTNDEWIDVAQLIPVPQGFVVPCGPFAAPVAALAAIKDIYTPSGYQNDAYRLCAVIQMNGPEFRVEAAESHDD